MQRKATSRHTVGQWLKAWLGTKKADGIALTLTTKENPIKKMLAKRFTIPLDFDFFKNPINPYGLKERLFIRLS